MADSPPAYGTVLIAHSWQRAARATYAAMAARYGKVTVLSWSALAGRQIDLEASFPTAGRVAMLSPEGHDMTALLLMERGGRHLALSDLRQGSLEQWPALHLGWTGLWAELQALAAARPGLLWPQMAWEELPAPGPGWQTGDWRSAPEGSLLLWRWPGTAWRLPAVWGRRQGAQLDLRGWLSADLAADSRELQAGSQLRAIAGGAEMARAMEAAGASCWWGPQSDWPGPERQEPGPWPQDVRADAWLTGRSPFPAPFEGLDLAEMFS